MNRKQLTVAAVLLCTAACNQSQPQNDSNFEVLVPKPGAPVSNPPPPAPHPPQPIVDPKSSEAAVELVQGFVDLVNQHKFDEAYMLLGPNAPPRADFDRSFSRYSDLQVSVGQPGDQEGAAGSIYLSVPLTIAGDLDGQHTARSATAIVRRINDVPGSTEAQRHWHIERIDWGTSP